jgi:hypothetical protein
MLLLNEETRKCPFTVIGRLAVEDVSRGRVRQGRTWWQQFLTALLRALSGMAA